MGADMFVRMMWLTGLLIVVGTAIGGAQVRGPISLPVDMEVRLAPTPVKAGGKTHLVYELHLTNFSPSELTIARVEVLGADAKPLAQYEGAELNTRLLRPGLPPANQEKQRVGGGMRA